MAAPTVGYQRTLPGVSPWSDLCGRAGQGQ